MKLVFTLFLLASSILAQDQSTADKALAACGPDNANFQVKTHSSRPSITAPEARKSTVYVIEEQLTDCWLCAQTVRVGLDGEWVGANHGSSFFFFSVAPGEHHLCADWQKGIIDEGDERLAALASLTAEPGKIYYFRASLRRDGPASTYYWHIRFEPIDPDEGQFLVTRDSFKFSTSQAEK